MVSDGLMDGGGAIFLSNLICARAVPRVTTHGQKALLHFKKIIYFRFQLTHPPPTQRKEAGGTSSTTTKSTKYTNQGVSQNYVTNCRSLYFRVLSYTSSATLASNEWLTPNRGPAEEGKITFLWSMNDMYRMTIILTNYPHPFSDNYSNK